MFTERLFLGIHLYPLFSREISDIFLRLRPLFFDQKWVNAEFVHWTVHFLGEIDAAQKQKVIQIADEQTRSQKPFQIALHGMNAFPDKNQPRVVWVGGSQKYIGEAAAFQSRVSRALNDAGFPSEREIWIPHATLFRTAPSSRFEWDEKLLSFAETAPQTVQALVLFKSILKPKGSEYEPCHVFPFGGSVY